ncbi:MAG TPA: PilZ domain-containing protein [Persephonella sp.]|nr:PilZ domain-containing protein [Persephonella sp.]
METSLIHKILKKKEIEVYAFYDEIPIKVKLKLFDVDFDKQQIIWSFNDRLKLPLTKSKELYLQENETVYTLVVIIYNKKEIITTFPTVAVEPKLKRRYIRVRTTEDDPIYVEIKNIRGKSIDISERGVGIIVNNIRELETGQIYNIKLEIRGNTYDLKGKIIYITEVEPGTYRIGIQFTNISQKVEDIIFKYILNRQKDVIKKISLFSD